MFDVSDIIVPQKLSIIDAIHKIDTTSKKILIVSDEDRRLSGVITDGDIRRWILKNGDLHRDVSNIMNRNPILVQSGDEASALNIMKSRFIDAVPVIDRERRVVDVVFWNDEVNGKLKRKGSVSVPVVIMAGGKGTRLYPYTKILPKPLVPIGDTPIVERIIQRFVDFGARSFYMTVNYKKNMIKSYFNDIEKEYSLQFVEEETPLGTGGSLALLRDELETSFFVSNCDILIDADYSDILDYHRKNNHHMTVITSLKNFKIPYGVVELDCSGAIHKTREKPEYNYLVNTGLYLIEPELINMIPNNRVFHLTELVDLCITKGLKIGTYPVRENSWLDMGQFDEMENMLKKLGVDK